MLKLVTILLPKSRYFASFVFRCCPKQSPLASAALLVTNHWINFSHSMIRMSPTFPRLGVFASSSLNSTAVFMEHDAHCRTKGEMGGCSRTALLYYTSFFLRFLTLPKWAHSDICPIAMFSPSGFSTCLFSIRFWASYCTRILIYFSGTVWDKMLISVYKRITFWPLANLFFLHTKIRKKKSSVINRDDSAQTGKPVCSTRGNVNITSLAVWQTLGIWFLKSCNFQGVRKSGSAWPCLHGYFFKFWFYK